MGRRIGNFTNAITGEIDWIDLGKISDVAITPDRVACFKDVKETPVFYRLRSNDATKMIEFIGEYKHQNDRIISQPINIPEDIFARQLADVAYTNKTFDSAPIAIEAKKKAMQSIGEFLLNKGVLISNSTFNGIGFICSNEARVISIEDIATTVCTNGTIDIKLNNCVGSAQLKNVISPTIEFFVNNCKIVISNYVVKEETGINMIRNYVINATDISIYQNEDTVLYQDISFDINNEESVEAFIAVRKCLLSDGFSQETVVDERFADLFA